MVQQDFIYFSFLFIIIIRTEFTVSLYKKICIYDIKDAYFYDCEKLSL